MVVDDDDYDDDVWDDATEGWGWGSNGKWCMIHKIDYILTIVTDWLSDWLTKQNPEMLSHLKRHNREKRSIIAILSIIFILWQLKTNWKVFFSLGVASSFQGESLCLALFLPTVISTPRAL